MNPCPKQIPFRSPKLLKLAAEIPHCCGCKAPNSGQIVACHPNAQKYGKGMGTKAHDLPAYLCGSCHDLLDGRVHGWDQNEREFRFLEAAYLTWLWLMQSGHLEVK